MAYNETSPFPYDGPESFLDERAAVYKILCEDVAALAAACPDRPLVVGINGIDTSGKTQFALGLADELAAQGTHVQPVHIDDFSNPRSVRSTTPDPVYNYYHHCFDLDALIGSILEPARQEGKVETTLDHIDLETDERSLTRRYAATPGSILLVEGVFLFRPELLSYIDYRVFLDIPVDTMMQRAAERDVPRFGAAVLDKYRDKYMPAQLRYLESVRPDALADVVVDNADWRTPAIIKRDQGKSV